MIIISSSNNNDKNGNNNNITIRTKNKYVWGTRAVVYRVHHMLAHIKVTDKMTHHMPTTKQNKKLTKKGLCKYIGS
jgi:hypothetical protein